MRHFIDHILSDFRGQIIACNILDGLEECLYDENFVREIFIWWKAVYLKQPMRSYNVLIATLDTVVFQPTPRRLRTHRIKPNFSLVCLRNTRLINSDTELTTVIQANILKDIISKEDLDRLYAHGIEFPSNENQWNEELIDDLMNLPESLRKAHLDVGATLGRNLLWFTLKQGFKYSLESRNNLADRARDTLGLIHHGSGKILMALHFSGDAVKKLRSGRPTFSDAGSHFRYKTQADVIRNKRRKNWGHTLDLENFASKQSNTDGLPEQVSEPIDNEALSNYPEIEFTLLGKVELSRGNTINDNNVCYANRLLNGLNKLHLKNKLVRLL